MNKILENLELNLKEPISMDLYLKEMAPRTPEKYKYAPPNARKAAVLIGLYTKPESTDIFFSLIKRKVVKGDRHSGQISLPGGRYDQTDIDLEYCALRENQEEIGIPLDQVRILGALSDFYVYASNYLVSPYVGYISPPLDFKPEEKEVARIIESSMTELVDPDTRKLTNINIPEGSLKNVPYYDIDNEIVWGATAMILSEFLMYWKKSI